MCGNESDGRVYRHKVAKQVKNPPATAPGPLLALLMQVGRGISKHFRTIIYFMPLISSYHKYNTCSTEGTNYTARNGSLSRVFSKFIAHSREDNTHCTFECGVLWGWIYKRLKKMRILILTKISVCWADILLPALGIILQTSYSESLSSAGCLIVWMEKRKFLEFSAEMSLVIHC